MQSPIETTVQYLKNDKALAVYKASEAGGKLESHEGNYSEHTVSVTNGRDSAEQHDLDREGFRLVDQVTAVSDFYDDAQLPIYETEIKNLLSKATGSTEIRIFDHTRRSSSASIRSKKNIRESSSVIHNDYSDNSGHTRLSDYLNAESKSTGNKLESELLKRDFALTWRAKGVHRSQRLVALEHTRRRERFASQLKEARAPG